MRKRASRESGICHVGAPCVRDERVSKRAEPLEVKLTRPSSIRGIQEASQPLR